MKKHQKSIACILAVCLFFILTLSNLYISEHTVHQCNHKHCKICITLHMAEDMVREVSSGLVTVLCLFAVLLFLDTVKETVFLFLRKNTLILLKVRLDR